MTSAWPDPAQADGAAARIKREDREWYERHQEFWDAGDQYDEELATEWDALDNPTRPPDRDLLP